MVEAFEQELGVRVGETTDDGTITLRKVECLGGCGWAPVVAVDERYREHFTPGRRRRRSSPTHAHATGGRHA